MFQKTKPFKNKKYLAWIRRQPCIECGKPQGVEAHHLIGVGGVGIMGGKSDDIWAMPLCSYCHQAMHHNRELQELQWEWIARTVQRACREGILKMGGKR